MLLPYFVQFNGVHIMGVAAEPMEASHIMVETRFFQSHTLSSLAI